MNVDLLKLFMILNYCCFLFVFVFVFVFVFEFIFVFAFVFAGHHLFIQKHLMNAARRIWSNFSWFSTILNHKSTATA